MTEESNPKSEIGAAPLSRRTFLAQAAAGCGGLTLLDLLPSAALGAIEAKAATGAPANMLHHPATAKRVIFLFMAGAPSQIDTFDYKPALAKMQGIETPPSVLGSQRLSTMVKGQTSFPLVGPLSKFAQRGKSGIWVSDLMPHVAEVVDECCVIKSMITEQVNHDPAIKFIQSGFQLAGRPSIGAWVHYGLGSDNTDLPSFIVMSSMGKGPRQNINSEIWSSGFLPSHHGGVLFMPGKDAVLYVANPDGISQARRQAAINTIDALA